jgi:hypothetical protein
MLKERSFQFALFVSILIHIAVFYQLPQINVDIRKTMNKLEITYQHINGFPKQLKILTEGLKESNRRYHDRIHIVKTPQSFKSFFKDKFQIENFKLFQAKPKIAKVETQQKKRSVSSSLDSEMDNPLYKSYYEQIREKIKKQAYRNYTRYDEGEVYLSFVIASDGRLLATKLFKEKSNANDFLQNIAIKSVEDAAPYPKFPSDLNFPKLSFNVIISFELSN